MPFLTQALIPSWNWRIISIMCGGTPKRASTCQRRVWWTEPSDRYNKGTAVRLLSFPTFAACALRTTYIRRRAVRAEPALLLRLRSLSLAVGAESRSGYLEKDFTRVCYESDAAIVLTLGPVIFMQNAYHGISPPLRYLLLIPHQLDHPVKPPEHDRVMVQPEFEEFYREFIWPHCLRVRHRPQSCGYLVFRRLDPECVCERSLGKPCDDVGSGLSDFALRRAPKNSARLPRISPGSRGTLPSSSWMNYKLTFRVSSMLKDSMCWKSPL